MNWIRKFSPQPYKWFPISESAYMLVILLAIVAVVAGTVTHRAACASKQGSLFRFTSCLSKNIFPNWALPSDMIPNRIWLIYRLPPLPPTSKTRWFDFLMVLDWFASEMGSLVHPDSVFCVVQPCRGLFFSEKHDIGEKTWFSNDFSLKWT